MIAVVSIYNVIIAIGIPLVICTLVGSIAYMIHANMTPLERRIKISFPISRAARERRALEAARMRLQRRQIEVQMDEIEDERIAKARGRTS